MDRRFADVALVMFLCISTIASCAQSGPQLSFEEKYPNARCRYEVSKVTANMGCSGCFEKNIHMMETFDDLYGHCAALKSR